MILHKDKDLFFADGAEEPVRSGGLGRVIGCLGAQDSRSKGFLIISSIMASLSFLGVSFMMLVM